MKELSAAEIGTLLVPYCPAQDQGLIEHSRAYIRLLLEWNEKISLTNITEPVDIVKRHFGESLFAASALKMRDGRLADVGSGAGFPGLPVAMANPGLQATLIEANMKRAAFLSEVVRRLNLSNVTVLRSRMEDIRGKEAFDFICARAIGSHANLMRWSRSKLMAKGKIVLFLGEGDVQKVRNASQWSWEPAIKIPDSSRRFILSGTAIP